MSWDRMKEIRMQSIYRVNNTSNKNESDKKKWLRIKNSIKIDVQIEKYVK